MTADHTTPVSRIEGIGPAIEQRLNAVGVWSVYDLLRVSRRRLFAAVADTYSFAQVASWKAMASLLEVNAMTAQFAEALAKSGTDAVEKLHRSSLTDLKTRFRDAETAGLIPSVPSDAELISMVRDAAVLAFTGSFTGTVTGIDDVPLAGARVSVGIRSSVTDSRGRFRVSRIRLGVSHVATIEATGHAPQVVDAPPLAVAGTAVRATVFRLASVAPADTPVRLDEYEGDVLPPLNGLGMRIERKLAGDLREGDILRVHRIDAAAAEAVLASSFRAYESGRSLVYSYRVPLALLPTDGDESQHLRVHDAELQYVRFNRSTHRARLALRRVRREFAGAPRPQTPAELRAALGARLVRLRELQND